MKVRTVALVALLTLVAACGAKSPTASQSQHAPEQPASDGSGFMGGN